MFKEPQFSRVRSHSGMEKTPIRNALVWVRDDVPGVGLLPCLLPCLVNVHALNPEAQNPESPNPKTMT